MKLAIVTAGAVGAFFGARLIQQGAEVTFVARRAHLTALREKGLLIQTREAEHQLNPDKYQVMEDPAEAVRGADLVLFAVKSYDTVAVTKALLPGLEAGTVVLSLQNGVGNEEAMTEIIGPERTAGGVAYVFAQLKGPGIISVPPDFGRLVVAGQTLSGGPIAPIEEFHKLCLAAKVQCEISPDIWKVKWSKLVFNSALNGWTALRRSTLDLILKDPELRPAFIATMQETAEVARAVGVNLDADIIEKTLALADSIGAGGSSMLTDRLAGKRLEVEALNGIVVHKGQALGIPTPNNQMLYEALKAEG